MQQRHLEGEHFPRESQTQKLIDLPEGRFVDIVSQCRVTRED